MARRVRSLGGTSVGCRKHPGLPRCLHQSQARRLGMGEKEGTVTPTILVVEDDASQRELLCELLQAHGYSCVAAEDGRRALDVIDRTPAPDAVVLDMVLPRLNGHELLRELDERGERRLGVVVVSGFGPVSRRSEERRVGKE